VKVSTNIYQAARIAAGLTQEKAAEAIGISVTAIKDYEAYNRLPPSDVVEAMCIVYNALHLAYQHTRLTSHNIQVVPDVDVVDLPTATIRLINRVMEFAEKHRDRQLLQIAEDGVISEAERPLFDEILKELDELIKASTEVRLATEKEDNQ